MPTKIELTLEQSQQGVSNDVLDKTRGVGKPHPRSWMSLNHHAHIQLSKSIIQLKIFDFESPHHQRAAKLKAQVKPSPTRLESPSAKIARHRIPGGCQILGGKLVCCCGKKQSSTAMSSVKAEYVAVAGCNYVSNDLTLVKPHTIIVASFKKLLAFEVPLTLHMLKVAKPFEEPERSLIPPFGEVNTDDTTDKSLSRASVQPITQLKAPTDLKTKKKRIPPSQTPKSPYKVTVIFQRNSR
ncbi:hypothetical protein Tco_0601546 [Tanacetum coccineum]